MSIEKKSLISTLKTTKKANVASAPVKSEFDAKADHTVSKRQVHSAKSVTKKQGMMSMKGVSKRSAVSMKSTSKRALN